MIKTGFCLLGAALALGTTVVLSWQPASVSALSKMNQAQRSEYLSSLEAYDVVGYYCDREALPTDVKEDVIASLSKVYGVKSVSCGAEEKTLAPTEM